MEIQGINITPPNSITEPKEKENSPNNLPAMNFGEILNDAISKVNELEHESDKMNEKLAMGEVENLHDVVIASEKADIALNLAVQVRNKLVEAHEEIMRMQI